MSAAADKLKEGMRDVEIDPDEIRFLSLAEFVQQPDAGSQIEGIDPGCSIVVAFGPPKGGKTFSICDLTMHAAHGKHWHGCEVDAPLRVAYLAGEGTKGLKLRLHAWLQEHQSSTAAKNFIVLPRALSLPDQTDKVLAALRDFRPHIIVTDTLNAFFGAGDENATKDMTAFVSAIRRLRDELKCSVYVIHHTGHGDQSRERGSIVLRASAEVLIHIAKDGNGSGNIAFQVIDGRDIEAMETPLGLRLRRVETDWKDRKGRPLVTCVVERADGPVELPSRVSRPMGEAQRQLLDYIRQAHSAAVTPSDKHPYLKRHEIAEAARVGGMTRQRISESWKKLEARGFIKLIEPGTVQVRA